MVGARVAGIYTPPADPRHPGGAGGHRCWAGARGVYIGGPAAPVHHAMPVADYPTPTDSTPLAPPRIPIVTRAHHAGRDLAWWGRCARAGSAVLLAAWAVRSLAWPLSGDQGIFAWVGDVILGGGLPYRDAWDVKGPVAYYLAAFAQLVFGRHEWTLRAFDLLWQAAGAAGVAALVGRLVAERAAAWWGAGLYLLWYASLDHRTTAQPDGWAAVLLVGAAYALVRGEDERTSARGAVVAGLCVGLCALIKPTYAAFLIAPLFHAAEATGTGERRAARLAASWGATAAGFALPLVLCAGWFASQGALDELFEVYVSFPLLAYAPVSGVVLWRLQEVARWLLLGGTLSAALPLALVGGRVLMARREVWVLVTAWIAAAVLNVVVQGQFTAYHWLPLYAPVAVLVGVGAGAVYRAVRDARDARGGGAVGRAARQLLGASAAVVVCAAAVAPAQQVYRWAKSRRNAAAADAFERREYGLDGRHTESFRTIARYVARRTRPGDRVLVWGRHPGFNYVMDRPSIAGRFGFPPLGLDRAGSSFAARYRRELLAAIAQAPPAYVVVMRADACRETRPRPETCADALPGLPEFLAANYRVEATIAVSTDSTTHPYEVLRRAR